MERCLTDLEAQPNDSGLLGEIFRSVHTIKGTTGFLGFKRLESLAHSGENLLGLLRDGKLVAERPVITGLLKLLDGLRSILKTIETEDSEGTGNDAVLINLMEELQTPAQAAEHAQTSASVPAAPAVATAGASAVHDTPKTETPKAEVHKADAPKASAGPREAGAAEPAPAEAEATKTRAGAAPAAGSAAESTLRVDVALLNRMMNLVAFGAASVGADTACTPARTRTACLD